MLIETRNRGEVGQEGHLARSLVVSARDAVSGGESDSGRAGPGREPRLLVIGLWGEDVKGEMGLNEDRDGILEQQSRESGFRRSTHWGYKRFCGHACGCFGLLLAVFTSGMRLLFSPVLFGSLWSKMSYLFREGEVVTVRTCG